MLKLNLLLFDLGFQQRLQPLNQFQKVAFFLHQTHLSAFNFGHIQNVVDQAKKLCGRVLDFFQAIHSLCLSLTFLQGNLRHTDDSIHWRSDLV